MTTRKIAAAIKVTPKKVTATKPSAAIKATVSQPTVVKIVAAKPIKKIKKEKKSAAKADLKGKVVRDSFTMPQDDYAKIAKLKQSCIKAGLHVKKSELLRAGLRALDTLTIAQLKQAIGKLDTIKTGRPKKSAT
jgi:hypothetical protein